MASLLRRVSTQFLRSPHQRGGHGWPGGSFWADGTQTGRNGYLFGESPPPPGQKRKWESWEMPFYTTMGICTLVAYLIVNGPEEATVAGRARPQALREIAEEDVIFADYAADKPLQQATAARLRAQGKHPDRYYDEVMMRNEFDTLKAKAAAA